MENDAQKVYGLSLEELPYRRADQNSPWNQIYFADEKADPSTF